MRSAKSYGGIQGKNNPNLLPFWEKDRGRLWYGNLLIKEFHQRAPFQRLVLDTFQEVHWQSRIDDPLPWDENVDAHERLRNVAKGLNRDQLVKILEFWTDGTGTGLCWAVRQVAHRRAPAPTKLLTRKFHKINPG